MLYNSYIAALYVLGFDTGHVLFRKHGNYIMKLFLTLDSCNVYKYPEVQIAKEKYVVPYYLSKDTVYVLYVISFRNETLPSTKGEIFVSRGHIFLVSSCFIG